MPSTPRPSDLELGTTYLELRISDRCGAARARISHSVVGDRVSVVDQDGCVETAAVPDNAATAQYLDTRMIAAAQHAQVRACVQPRGGERQCTPWGANQPVPVPPPAHPLSLPPSPAR